MSTINADTLSVKNLSVTGTLSYGDVTAQTSLPATPSPGTIMETFAGMCDGRSITVPSGTYTLQNVSGTQIAESGFTDITGSVISYKPPAGTKSVVYEFNFQHTSYNANGISYCKMVVDGIDINPSRFVVSDNSTNSQVHFMQTLRIGVTEATSSGDYETWPSNKTISLQFNYHGGSHRGQAHGQYYTSSFDTYRIPNIRITAIA